MVYSEPAVVATYKGTSVIQMHTGLKRGGAQDAPETFTNNPAYEGDD